MSCKLDSTLFNGRPWLEQRPDPRDHRRYYRVGANGWHHRLTPSLPCLFLSSPHLQSFVLLHPLCPPPHHFRHLCIFDSFPSWFSSILYDNPDWQSYWKPHLWFFSLGFQANIKYRTCFVSLQVPGAPDLVDFSPVYRCLHIYTVLVSHYYHYFNFLVWLVFIPLFFFPPINWSITTPAHVDKVIN